MRGEQNKTVHIVRVLFVSLFAAAVLLMGSTADTAKAATTTNTSAITNLKQESASSSSFKISWDGVLGAHGYEIEVVDERGNKATYESLINTVYTVALNLSPATHYTVRVRVKGSAYWSETDVVTAPKYSLYGGKVTQEADGSSVTAIALRWSACSGAEAYRIDYWAADSSAQYAKSLYVIGETSCTLTGLKKDMTYSVRVYPYCISRAATPFETFDVYSNPYASESGCAVVPGKIKEIAMEDFLVYASQSKLAWSESKVAAGYEWEVKSGSKKVDGGTTKQRSVYSTKLNANKFYRVRVRGYIQIGGDNVYGAWSDWKYVSSQPKKVTYTQSAGKLSLSWSKVSGATSYTIYMSTKKPSDIREMKKVKTVSKPSCSMKKFNGKPIDGKKRYYIVIVANKKIDDTTYRSISKYVNQTK